MEVDVANDNTKTENVIPILDEAASGSAIELKAMTHMQASEVEPCPLIPLYCATLY